MCPVLEAAAYCTICFIVFVILLHILILYKWDSWINIKNFFLLTFSWGRWFIAETCSRVYEYTWCVILYSLCAYVGTYKCFSCLFHDIVAVILCLILVTFLPFYNFQDTYCLLWSPDSCVRIMTVLCTGRLRHRISILGEASDFSLLCSAQAVLKPTTSRIQRFFVSPHNMSWRHGRGL